MPRVSELVPDWNGHGAAGIDVRRVTADSRLVGQGSLFVAIPGGRTDGRDFIAEAVDRGAAAVLAPLDTRWPPGVAPRPLLLDPQPRRRLAEIAARLAGPPPPTLVAVTGTNGKTSTVEFLRQLWAMSGRSAASLGTLGVIAAGRPAASSAAMTTPDPVVLSETLAELAASGVSAAALEASSHGLDQFRLDGLRFAAGAFTNLTRDHLDYHGDVAAYRAAKLRLFETLIVERGVAIASTALDAETSAALREIATRRRLTLQTVGDDGTFLRLVGHRPTADGMVVEIAAHGTGIEVALALPGRFQADNVLVASALALATGVTDVWSLLPRLTGVRGRMELAARLPNGAAAYVDYAHTPDALERLLTALRPHARRLVVVFGAGGDRDPGKRPLMGAACAHLADLAIVTDDNPRSEDAPAIRQAVLAGCPGGVDGGTREAAIATGLSALRGRDVLVVAGKGHEQGQTIAGVTLPFDDVTQIRKLAGLS